MPVRRVERKKSRGKDSVGLPELPSKPKPADTDPLKYTLLLYGREKIGKTTWLSSFPDTLFLTTEPGTKGLRIFEYNANHGGCRSWDYIRAAVKLLEQEPGRFKTVVIDTADRAYEMCMDYVCKNLGIPHPGEDSSGKRDYGKSWKEVRKEFTSVIHRILQTGRGLALTSHAKEETFRSRSGEEFTRIHPSMSGQARAVVEALVDCFFYCEYMRSEDGSTRRVIVTKGDEIVFAGHRSIDGRSLPALIPMTEEGGFDIYSSAFAGEPVGLDTKTLLPSKTAPESIRRFFANIRRRSEKGGVKKKKALKRRRK